MEKETNLPFKVGDLAESRTFEAGFRGAWFRCKIKDITEEEGRLVHVLEYYDFPDEALDKMRIYQVPPYLVGDAKEELMLRPHYPPICKRKQIQNVSEISVVVNNSWKVGDFVDMHSNDCYWSGRIKQLLGNGTAKIELNPAPLGEGSEYDALLKNVRPSLDWSPQHGWTLPTQEGGRRCARLIKPVNQVTAVGGIQTGPKTNALMGSTGSSGRLPYSSNSGVSVSKITTEMLKQSLVSDEEEKGGRKGETSRDVEGYPQKPEETLDASVMLLEEYENKVKWLRKKILLQCGISSASQDVEPDTLVASVMVLEEYINKIKWLKKMLLQSDTETETESTQWELEL